MRPIKKHMRVLWTGFNAAVRPLSYLTVAASLSCCAGLRKFPVDRIWEFDAKSDVCAEYKLTDYNKLTYVWLRDVPRAQCPSIFGFNSSQIPLVLDWGQDAVAYGKKHCK